MTTIFWWVFLAETGGGADHMVGHTIPAVGDEIGLPSSLYC